MMFGKPKEKGLVQRVNVDGRTFTFTSLDPDATDKDRAEALIKLLALNGGDRHTELRLDNLELELTGLSLKVDNHQAALKIIRRRLANEQESEDDQE